MKALLRSSIFALFVFAGYAAVATDISKPHSNAGIPSTAVSASCSLRDWQVTLVGASGFAPEGLARVFNGLPRGKLLTVFT